MHSWVKTLRCWSPLSFEAAFQRVQVTLSLDCPGYSYIFDTLDSLIMDSWVRNNLHVVYAATDMCLLNDKDLQPDQRLRLGIRREKQPRRPKSIFSSALSVSFFGGGLYHCPQATSGPSRQTPATQSGSTLLS